MPITNPWVGYIQRTYQQIKDQVMTALQSSVPEITDHTESDLFVKMVGIWGGITEMIGYYLDNKGREVYLSTARKFSSAVKTAALFDYRVKGTSSASTGIIFYFDTNTPTNFTIPAGTVVGTKEGIPYETVATVTMLAGTNMIAAQVIQRVGVTGKVLGLSTGLADQIFPLEANVVFNSINIVAGVDTYLNVPTLGYSSPADTSFISGVNESGIMVVQFGDNLSGHIPTMGSSIVAGYYTSSGASGNVGSDTITQIISSVFGIPLGLTLKVTNPDRASGGVDSENLRDLQRRIPLSTRTQLRAVTYDDYKSIAELSPGVEKAAVRFNCGKTVDVYVVPSGGGIATPTLLSSVVAFFEDKRMITTIVRALPAGEIIVQIYADVTIKDNYIKTSVANSIILRLTDFLSVQNQDIGGAVHLSDIYQIIEDTDGVAFSEINGLQPIPFALVNGSTTTALNWVPTVKPASVSTVPYRIQMNSSTVYQLYRANTYLGNYNVGDTVDLAEISFLVNAGAYVSGDSWTFVVYPYFGSFQLQEVSIPISFVENIVLNMKGGI